MKNESRIDGELAYIKIRRSDGTSLETVIDASDLETADSIPGTWCVQFSENTQGFYVVSSIAVAPNKRRRIRLHRLLLGNPDLILDVDHINRNTLDNRRANIRVATRLENLENRSVPQSALGMRNSIAGKGYYKDAHSDIWMVRLIRDGKVVFRKYYKTEEEAAKVAKELRSNPVFFPNAA